MSDDEQSPGGRARGRPRSSPIRPRSSPTAPPDGVEGSLVELVTGGAAFAFTESEIRAAVAAVIGVEELEAVAIEKGWARGTGKTIRLLFRSCSGAYKFILYVGAQPKLRQGDRELDLDLFLKTAGAGNLLMFPILDNKYAALLSQVKREGRWRPGAPKATLDSTANEKESEERRDEARHSAGRLRGYPRSERGGRGWAHLQMAHEESVR